MRSLLTALLPLLLSACVYIPVEDYVHQQTHALRDFHVHLWPQAAEEVAGKAVVLVPDFRSFTNAYLPGRAALKIFSASPRALRIEKAVITNLDTGVSREVLVDELVQIDRPHYSTGYFANYFVPLLGEDNSLPFLNASEIEVEVSYVLSPGQAATEVFVIERVVPWQWVSPV